MDQKPKWMRHYVIIFHAYYDSNKNRYRDTVGRTLSTRIEDQVLMYFVPPTEPIIKVDPCSRPVEENIVMNVRAAGLSLKEHGTLLLKRAELVNHIVRNLSVHRVIVHRLRCHHIGIAHVSTHEVALATDQRVILMVVRPSLRKSTLSELLEQTKKTGGVVVRT